MEENNNEVKNKKKSKIIIPIIVVIILCIIFCGLYIYDNNQTQVTVEFNSVKKICELATLRSYYHDVLEYKNEGNNILNIGYKKYWVEYDGFVELGIDVNEVQVNKPDENGIIKIYIPDARVIKVDVDKDSFSTPISETGFLTTQVTSTEKTNAFVESQKNLEKKAENNQSLHIQAKENAQKLLEQYIINIGKEINQNFTVNWIDEPINNN